MEKSAKIVFHWTTKTKKREKLETTGEYFKNYAIELLEEGAFDKVFDVYYTVNNTITIKLDYYNAEGVL